MAYFGPIPTFQVSSNSLINNTIGGVVNSTVNGVVNVALSSSLGQQVTSSLGLGVLESPQNLVSSIATPGLLSTGSETLSNALTGAILKSNALGPAGPFVAQLGSSILTSLTGDLIQGLDGLGSSSGGPSRYFPGAGEEDEDANYGGSVYNQGEVGADVIFSIKPSQNLASVQAAKEVKEGGVPGTLTSGAEAGVPPSGLAESFTAASSSSSFITTGSVALANPVAPSGLASSFTPPAVGSPEAFAIAGSYSSRVTAPREVLAPAAATTTVTTNERPANQPATPADSLRPPNALAITPDTGEQVEDAAWKFTTTPGDITWETAAKVDRVPIFGTNKPPVIAGSRGMRDLTLSNALIEGFTFGKSLEGKIAKLEALLNLTLTSKYVKVPVYWVSASDKRYGSRNKEGGFFVIKQIKVKEELRDLSGKTTRAMVDVSFTQVPDYQVDDGRDLASKSVAGGKSILSAVSDQVDKYQKEQAARARAQAAANPGSGGTRTQPSGSSTGQTVLYNGVLVPAFRIENNQVLLFDSATGRYQARTGG